MRKGRSIEIPSPGRADNLLPPGSAQLKDRAVSSGVPRRYVIHRDGCSYSNLDGCRKALNPLPHPGHVLRCSGVSQVRKGPPGVGTASCRGRLTSILRRANCQQPPWEETRAAIEQKIKSLKATPAHVHAINARCRSARALLYVLHVYLCVCACMCVCMIHDVWVCGCASECECTRTPVAGRFARALTKRGGLSVCARARLGICNPSRQDRRPARFGRGMIRTETLIELKFLNWSFSSSSSY